MSDTKAPPVENDDDNKNNERGADTKAEADREPTLPDMPHTRFKPRLIPGA